MPVKISVIGLIFIFFGQGVLFAAAADTDKQLRKKIDDLRHDNAKLVGELYLQRGSLAKLERSNLEFKKQLEQLTRDAASRAEKKRKERKTKPASSVNDNAEVTAAGEVILYKELGNGYLQSRQFDQAIGAFEKALSVDAKDADACYNLGLLYKHHRNDPAKAITYLKRYIALTPLAQNRADVEYLIRMLESEGPAYP